MIQQDSLIESKRHFYELDILRFLAALSVVFFHYTFLNAIVQPTTPDYPFFSDVFKYGYLGVDLFFIISGFVILLSTGNKTAIGFSISRITRLYPAFWVAVTLTALALWQFSIANTHSPGLYQYLANLTMVPEYLGVENIDSVYWTLQIEIKFYFWVFVIMLFKKIQHIEGFILLWLLMAVLEIFHFIHGFTHQFLIPEWAPYFGAGALFYRIWQKGFNWQRGAMLVLAYGLSLYYAIEGANLRTESYGSVFSPYVVSFLTTSFYLLFVLIVFNRKTSFKRAWLTLLGVVTYPLYLIHDAIGQLFFYYFAHSVNKYMLLFDVILFMIITSYLIYHYFEVPMSKKMKNKLCSLEHRIATKIKKTPSVS